MLQGKTKGETKNAILGVVVKSKCITNSLPWRIKANAKLQNIHFRHFVFLTKLKKAFKSSLHEIKIAKGNPKIKIEHFQTLAQAFIMKMLKTVKNQLGIL